MLARKIAVANDSLAEFVVGSVNQLEFADDCFDYVIGVAILHHLPEQGVVDTLSEAYRVLKPGGKALFVEPVENSRVFDFVQNLVPTKSRPSILERRAYASFLADADDRALTDAELMRAGARFSAVDFRYYGLLVRLSSLLPDRRVRRVLSAADSALTAPSSPVRKYGQQALVTFVK
jgi:ubiquinone/menaquinone biosynthesis C-methylase UbiE